ncbi:SdiA-regulated domain-containing protein [Leeuwenhoekiella sp. W20_SRS_FM14]|uniref:SdiA-regulated domain-containing protein n=1 Tax=Leeuwenhoekiella sp. W20_SRS_FM14 TaxID=3240270 RepID=UPI003F9DE5D7
MKYLAHYVIVGALCFSGILSYAFYKKSIAEEKEILENATYTIVKTWELPELLNEVSGLAWVNDSTLACIQDEDGYIYHYNLNSEEISYDVEFAENGDYEAIALDSTNAYIMRSDGRIFEVLNYMKDTLNVSHFNTPFDEDNNIESLAFNPKTRNLITVSKDKGLNEKRFKGIYEIPLDTKVQKENPVVQIDMNAEAFADFQKKKEQKTFNPSDLAIHPKTGDYYIVDGKKPKLLILNPNGSIKALHELNTFHFAQPEGITFSPDGKLYIANEAASGVATLMEVTLDEH